ncbi:MAG: hypothetical protein M5U26_12530 [Planctomycetota bacterium]|nr:hypothetical protein [Planctomycetota bacterium]
MNTKIIDRISYEEAVNALVGRSDRDRFRSLNPTSIMIRLLRHAGRTERWMTFEVQPRGPMRTRYITARFSSRGRMIGIGVSAGQSINSCRHIRAETSTPSTNRTPIP